VSYGDCHPLVVEDDPDFLFLLRRVLVRSGVPAQNIRARHDGESALAEMAAAGPRPSLVILDHKLPKMTGLEVLGLLRSREGAPPIFFMSSSDDPLTVGDAYRLGAAAYYIKPLTLDLLQEHVAEMLACWRGLSPQRPPRGSLKPA
jgi:CheY-like chemotaxis protein